MNVVKSLGKLVLAGLIALAVLSLISLGYSYSGIHIDNKDGATDYKWKGNQWKSTMGEGFSWIRVDRNGFNNYIDTSGSCDILLMGSSHMEALNVRADESTGYLLNQYLNQYETYNIGTSGHTIYRCIDNVDNAVEVYAPEKYVVIETDTVQLEASEMDKVINGTAEKIVSYDSGLLYYMQQIPGLKWIYGQVSEWAASDSKTTAVDAFAAADMVDEPYGSEYTSILQEFLSLAKPQGENACQTVIFYQPESKIDAQGNWMDLTDRHCLKLFGEACKANDIKFIDMTPEFRELYREEKVLAHGFCNTQVGSGHLNRYGHKAIATRLSDVIVDMEKGKNNGVEQL